MPVSIIQFIRFTGIGYGAGAVPQAFDLYVNVAFRGADLYGKLCAVRSHYPSGIHPLRAEGKRHWVRDADRRLCGPRLFWP
jgi:hypothetical protein